MVLVSVFWFGGSGFFCVSGRWLFLGIGYLGIVISGLVASGGFWVLVSRKWWFLGQ